MTYSASICATPSIFDKYSVNASAVEYADCAKLLSTCCLITKPALSRTSKPARVDNTTETTSTTVKHKKVDVPKLNRSCHRSECVGFRQNFCKNIIIIQCLRSLPVY
mmetsp:Transcript_5830/g.11916  ORF Transcript_5830/g.11916 Transcript_5830/m.11916 type:complete len:107 (-) Transcript_5830:82-402(-)